MQTHSVRNGTWPRRRAAAHALHRLLHKWSGLASVLLLLAVSLVAGLLTLGDYGETWDEPSIRVYADYAIHAYRFFFHPAQLPPFDPVLSAYGPSYFIGAGLVVRALHLVVPALATPVAWHACYFVTFLADVLLLYALCRRWLRRLASLGACLLFVSQPLFWGHAFINPKDLPFMAFFLASVVLGFEMVDRFHSRNYLWVGLAGIMLGLATSFRLVGPLAGVFVGLYALWKSPRSSIALLIPYAAVALLSSYLTWPFLWGAPSAGLSSAFTPC